MLSSSTTYIFVFTRAFQRKRSRYKFGLVFYFFLRRSQNAVPLQRMRRINRRVHVLKQWLPSWTYLMYAKEIRWLLRSIYIQSHTPFAVDPHKNLWSVLGTGRSAIFMRVQFTSDPLRVNILSRNIKRNLLYQTSNLILCL